MRFERRQDRTKCEGGVGGGRGKGLKSSVKGEGWIASIGMVLRGIQDQVHDVMLLGLNDLLPAKMESPAETNKQKTENIREYVI